MCSNKECGQDAVVQYSAFAPNVFCYSYDAVDAYAYCWYRFWS